MRVLIEDIWRGCVYFFELVQLGARLLRGPDDVSLKPPWSSFRSLELHVRSGGHGKHIIEFFERSLLEKCQHMVTIILAALTYFGFGKPEPDHEECNSVQSSVESEGTLRFHGLEHSRKSKGEDGCPEVVRRHSPGHADFSVRKWEHLCGVGERHRAFARRVKYVEKVDEESDQPKVRVAALGNPETKSRRQQGPAHVWEGEK
jgi:hypothetical protein